MEFDSDISKIVRIKLEEAINIYNNIGDIMMKNNISMNDAMKAIPFIIAEFYSSSSNIQFERDIFVLTEFTKIIREMHQDEQIKNFLGTGKEIEK